MATLSSSPLEETIVVPKAEWDALVALRDSLPSLLQQAKLDRDKENLARLTQMHKENPERHREQSRKRYNMKKDEILAKKREAYRLKKEAKAAAALPPADPMTI